MRLEDVDDKELRLDAIQLTKVYQNDMSESQLGGIVHTAAVMLAHPVTIQACGVDKNLSPKN